MVDKFNVINLRNIFEERGIDAVLVVDLGRLIFYAFEKDHEAIEEILYKIKPIPICHEIKKIQYIHQAGLSVVEEEFDLNRLNNLNNLIALPKNKFKRFLIKFLI